MAKIKNTDELIEILRRTLIRSNTEGWTCVEWVREGLEAALRSQGVLGRAVSNWSAVRDSAMWYIEKKVAEGRFNESFDQTHISTWDVLSQYEIIS